MTEADSEPTSAILACEELNRPSDPSTVEFLSIFDIVLSQYEAARWVGLDCERVVDGNLVKRCVLFSHGRVQTLLLRQT